MFLLCNLVMSNMKKMRNCTFSLCHHLGLANVAYKNLIIIRFLILWSTIDDDCSWAYHYTLVYAALTPCHTLVSSVVAQRCLISSVNTVEHDLDMLLIEQSHQHLHFCHYWNGMLVRAAQLGYNKAFSSAGRFYHREHANGICTNRKKTPDVISNQQQG